MSGISHYDLLDLIGAKSNLSPKTVERMLKAMQEIIISELQNEGYITFNNFGRFELSKKGGTDEWVTNSLGLPEKRYIDVFDYVDFKPSKNYISKINKTHQDRITRATFDESEVYDSEKDIVNDMELPPSTSEMVRKLLDKKKQKLENKAKRDKEKKDNNISYKEVYEAKPVKCITNNTIYPSTCQASQKLNIRLEKLYKSFHKGVMEVDGYVFEFVDKKLLDKKIADKDLEGNNG